MTDQPAIYTALAAVMADVDHVAKRDRNDHQRFMFRGIDAVVNAVGPALRRHQVIVFPVVESVTYDTVATSTGKPATACRVVVTYRFAAVDGSTVEAKVAAEAWDAGDKAAPKAMSVAFRTALLQALTLPTDEPDPDSQTYERDHTTPAQPAVPQTPEQMAAESAAYLPTAPAHQLDRAIAHAEANGYADVLVQYGDLHMTMRDAIEKRRTDLAGADA